MSHLRKPPLHPAPVTVTISDAKQTPKSKMTFTYRMVDLNGEGKKVQTLIVGKAGFHPDDAMVIIAELRKWNEYNARLTGNIAHIKPIELLMLEDGYLEKDFLKNLYRHTTLYNQKLWSVKKIVFGDNVIIDSSDAEKYIFKIRETTLINIHYKEHPGMVYQTLSLT